MKKSINLLALILSGLLGLSSSAYGFTFLIYDARSAAMGGTGVASDPRNAVYHNPALLATMDEEYEWYAFLPAYGYSLSDTQDLESAVKNGSVNTLEDPVYRERRTLSGVLGIPSALLAGATYVNQYEIHTAKPSSDGSLLEHRGADVLEFGITMARLFNIRFLGIGEAKLGTNIDLQLIDAIGYHEDINDANIGLDKNGETNSTSTFNFDLGISKEVGVWKFGLALHNIIGKDINFGDTEDVFSIEPKASIGAAYRSRNTYFEINSDLNQTTNVAQDEKRMFAGVGFEHRLFLGVYLRAGYQQSLVGEMLPTGTYGLGLDIYGFQLDAGGMTNSDENSVFAQLTLKI
ncbi:conjugal transfer protein TraF [Kaarinaea lacus]